MNPTALRTMVAGFLTDTCTITTPGPGPVFDPDAGTYTDAAGDTVYTGACRLIAGGSRTSDVGDAQVPFGSYDVRLPWETTGVEVDQILTVTASTDPMLVGQALRVTSVHAGTDNAYRRVICEQAGAVATFDEEGS